MRFILVLGSFFLTMMSACNEQGGGQDFVPNVPVNIRVILTNSSSQGLYQFPNYIYLKGGFKGIILHRNGQGVLNAFDRSCSFRPLDSCARVSVHKSGLYLTDSCCKSQFDFDGSVTIGPAVLPLRSYRISYITPNEILIQN